MARTIRRKNARWNSFGNYDMVKLISKYGGSYSKCVNYEKDSLEYKKFWNKFHSDKDRYENGVPGWYVNMNFEKPLRKKTKQLLSEWKKNPQEDVVLPEYFRCAGYDWY